MNALKILAHIIFVAEPKLKNKAKLNLSQHYSSSLLFASFTALVII